MKDLGNLGGTNGSIGAYSLVNALNNRGQVIGDMALPGEMPIHPLLWDGEKLSEVVGYSYFSCFLSVEPPVVCIEPASAENSPAFSPLLASQS